MAGRLESWFTAGRRVRVEAAAWGALIALNSAFVSLLLISRGAATVELAIYASGASVFGLGASVIGPWAALRAGSAKIIILAAIGVGRAILAVVPLLLLRTDGVTVAPLIAALLVWSAGEGIAQPLWIAHLTGLSESAKPSGWLSARATAAAIGAACAMLPLVILARLLPTEQSLLAAYAVALGAAAISTCQMAALLRLPWPVSAARSPGGHGLHAGPGFWFLGGLFAFWFGAALNRPVLPPYVVNELHAPAAYFATAAVVAAVAGAGLQPRWGSLGIRGGARPLLAWSGLAAGVTPLLWTIVPDYRFGIPVEVLASSCWLGHLLGLHLHAVEAAMDNAQRSFVIARMQLVQGSAAAVAPLAAAAMVETVGTSPILIASGVICLGATAVMADIIRAPAGLPLAIAEAASRVRLMPARQKEAWSRIMPRSHTPTPRATVGARSLARPDGTWPGSSTRRLPLSIVRALSADCPSCLGIGCAACHGIGLR